MSTASREGTAVGAIVARVCLVEWQSESASLLPPDAIAFLDSVRTVSRDSRDNSYDRPLNITRVPLRT